MKLSEYKQHRSILHSFSIQINMKNVYLMSAIKCTQNHQSHIIGSIHSMMRTVREKNKWHLTTEHYVRMMQVVDVQWMKNKTHQIVKNIKYVKLTQLSVQY